MNNSFGKTSTVNITAAYKDNKTYLEDVYFTAPFKIAKPFEFGENGIDVLIMSASAGLMNGDIQEYNINVKKNSFLKISSQSFEKIHKMDEGKAVRTTNITVDDNAYLYFAPLPTIPFEGSSFENNMTVKLLNKSSRFILSEIITCGRYSRDEIFKFDNYYSKLNVYCDDELIVNDILSLSPKDHSLNGFGYFEGCTHLANIMLFNCTFSNEIIDTIRTIIEGNKTNGGVTLLWDNSIAIRMLSSNSQTLIDISDYIIEKFNKEIRNENI